MRVSTPKVSLTRTTNAHIGLQLQVRVLKIKIRLSIEEIHS